MAYCTEFTASKSNQPLAAQTGYAAANRIIGMRGIADTLVALSVDVFQAGEDATNKAPIGRLRAAAGGVDSINLAPSGVMVGSGGIDVVFNDVGAGHILDIYWE